MSLYNRSSLIQVPSLYKDGTLVSTIPEDRSGDFTVARGSNLAATRVGEDGYIKKGYENLFLQSNSFDNSPSWGGANVSLTGGQESYDGSNNAWLLQSTNTTSSSISQLLPLTGLYTFSIYAKAGTANYLMLYKLTDGARIWFDLSNGTIGSGGTGINASIEDVGNGWYRCSFPFNGTLSYARIYVADTNNSFNSALGSNIYIQDAQLNQGLVAYPYLETTDSPAQGGLLENSPRLDWSNGVPAVLVEEQRTNLIPHSEHLTNNNSFSLINATQESGFYESPEGANNAYKWTTTTANSNALVDLGRFNTTNGTAYTFSFYLKSDVSNVNVRCSFTQGTTEQITANLTTEWKRFDITFTADDTRKDFLILFGDYGITNPAQTIFVYGIMQEQASTPSSYIPTYGTSQTRSNEVISDNFNIPTTATIYNSFYSDTAKTVFVLDQVFNVAEGLNKVAIAFSPTAVKISVGGSIVANATGTYDTTALSNIQLGSNNGTDYSNAPISGFYVFPEFLTDEELNSLTD